MEPIPEQDPQADGDPWLTIAEIAAELRLSPATIRSWISKGTLRAKRAGHRKWLVRRSELARMLDGADFEDAGSAPPESKPELEFWPRHRVPETIAPPGSIPWDVNAGEPPDPEEWLAVAQWEWLASLNQSQMAPPDAWFHGRVRSIAEAAARKAEALALFSEDQEMRWESEPATSPLTLSYELRPGAIRPGPVNLWVRFDAAVEELGGAIADGRAGRLRCGLESVSLALHEIADALGRYRGRYGNWQELPPDDVDK